MTGPQLRKWRLDHDLTLREVAETLDGLTHSTISRWETSPENIPSWAEAKILATTQITLPLDELHSLLDAAREDNTPAQELIARAIQEYLKNRQPIDGGCSRHGSRPAHPILREWQGDNAKSDEMRDRSGSGTSQANQPTKPK